MYDIIQTIQQVYLYDKFLGKESMNQMKHALNILMYIDKIFSKAEPITFLHRNFCLLVL